VEIPEAASDVEHRFAAPDADRSEGGVAQKLLFIGTGTEGADIVPVFFQAGFIAVDYFVFVFPVHSIITVPPVVESYERKP
jgi:hypothetical protein